MGDGKPEKRGMETGRQEQEWRDIEGKDGSCWTEGKRYGNGHMKGKGLGEVWMMRQRAR